MPNKKKRKKGPTRSRRAREEREVIVEERTRVIPARRVIVRPESVTLSRALGEAAVVEPAAEPRVTTETVIKRRKRS